MKGFDGQVLQARKIREQALNAGLHLPRGLAGEGEGQDRFRVHAPAGQEIGQAVGQGPGLAGARTRLDDQRRPGMEDGPALGRVQAGQQGVFLDFRS